MKQIKEILIASVSLFLLGFGICMAVRMKVRCKLRHRQIRRPLIFKP